MAIIKLGPKNDKKNCLPHLDLIHGSIKPNASVLPMSLADPLIICILLYFGDNLKTANTQISCNIGKSVINPEVIFRLFYATAYLRVLIQKLNLVLKM